MKAGDIRFLKSKNYAFVSVMIGELEVNTMTPMLQQMEEQLIDAVAVQLDIWISEKGLLQDRRGC